jgi:hypothetical protein
MAKRKLAAAMCAEQRALWSFIRCPALDLRDLRLRAQFLQAVMGDSLDRGTPTDNHHIIAVNLLASEILDSTETRPLILRDH